MPRPQPLYPGFFDSDLTEDVESLLARFQQADSVRYELFSAIWREMGFTDVFLGVYRGGEMRTFCRVTMATAVKYFLPPYSYQIRVGGLYLMFAFYHTQVADPPVQIRLALRDYPDVQRFFQDSVDSGHHDVVYIYKKLIADKAIHYTAMPHFLTFQKQRKPKKERVCAEFLGRTTAVQELISAEVLEEVTNIQGHYQKMKEATLEVNGKVSMIHQDLASRLRDCLSEFNTWQQKTFSQDNKDKDQGDDDEDEEKEEKKAKSHSSSRAKLLSSIKQKGYGNVQEASKARRHRKVETVDSSSSGAEHHQEAPTRQKPPSLRARTWESLGVTQRDSKKNNWLLSALAPEQEDKVRVRRTNQVPSNRP